MAGFITILDDIFDTWYN
uniref:Uncharacterized protein n=1 Tax=Leersia perrieri TaxID=77586 RepID=A0A0D9X4S4_9ORYZ